MKTKKLIEAARICVSNSGKGCYYISHDGNCPYNTEEYCVDKMLTDLADRLEKLHERNKAKEVVDVMHLPLDTRSVGYCPNCEDGVNNTMHYCSKCGQKLKWEKVKK